MSLLLAYTAGAWHYYAFPTEKVPLVEAIGTVQTGITRGNATIVQRFYKAGATTGIEYTPAINTQSTNSALFVSMGRGTWAGVSPAAPSENFGNTLVNVGTITAFSAFPASEVGVWATLANTGGNGQIAQANWGPSGAGGGDEQTILAFEVNSVSPVVITSSSITADAVGNSTVVSSNVTTTSGPALLVAILWGNGNVGQQHNFTPTNGFTEWTQASADGDPDPNGYLQAATFYKYVSTSGTFNAQFTGTSNEGAIVYLFALQNSGSTAYTANLSETVTLSEAIAVLAAFFAGPSETVTLSESLVVLAASIVGISETVTVAEAVAVLAAFFATPSETVTLSELLVAGLLLTANVSETVTLSEAIAAQLAAIVAPSETVTLSESLGILAAFFATALAETVALSESLVAGLLLAANVSETVTLSEAIGVLRAATVGMPETVTFAEALGAAFGANAGTAETVALAEALGARLGATIGVSATLALAEAVAVNSSVTVVLIAIMVGAPASTATAITQPGSATLAAPISASATVATTPASSASVTPSFASANVEPD